MPIRLRPSASSTKKAANENSPSRRPLSTLTAASLLCRWAKIASTPAYTGNGDSSPVRWAPIVRPALRHEHGGEDQRGRHQGECRQGRKTEPLEANGRKPEHGTAGCRGHRPAGSEGQPGVGKRKAHLRDGAEQGRERRRGREA